MQAQLIIENWEATVKRTSSLIDELSSEELLREVSPNHNRGIYLLGHLTAVHDLMLPLLSFREALFPEIHSTFIKTPDNPSQDPYTSEDLRNKWATVNQELSKHFEKMTNEDWLQKHTAISDEDFEKEPNRNRLNVLLSRTIHLGYHQGQLRLLKK